MVIEKIKSNNELEKKCLDYVERKLSKRGGFTEAKSGFRHRTFPYLIGLESKNRTNLILASLLKLVPLILGAMVPIVARKVYPQHAAAASASPQGPEAVLRAMAAIDSTDAALIFVVMSIALLNKFSEKFFKASKVAEGNPHARICEAIEGLPLQQLAGMNSAPNANDALLKTCLAGIKHEISGLLLDESGIVISDVVYWEFVDARAKRMRVRARLVSDKPQRQSVDSHVLQAYYVARTGKIFAEHDFQHRDNPFSKERPSLVDRSTKATYKSILFIPIVTNDEEASDDGETIDRDYCIGVICVSSDRPFRFWRWGDHKRDEGTFGKVAYDHVRPYIQLIRRLSMLGAYRMEVNA